MNPELVSGMKVIVRTWDDEKKQYYWQEATLDQYADDGCWNFIQPCPVAWASPEDILPENQNA